MIQSTKGKQKTNKYYLLASTNLQKKDYTSAKSNLLKYLNNNQDYHALNLLGICHLNLKEYFKAANIFKELITNKIISDSIFKEFLRSFKHLSKL